MSRSLNELRSLPQLAEMVAYLESGEVESTVFEALFDRSPEMVELARAVLVELLGIVPQDASWQAVAEIVGTADQVEAARRYVAVLMLIDLGDADLAYAVCDGMGIGYCFATNDIRRNAGLPEINWAEADDI